jgi:hypothetical protein
MAIVDVMDHLSIESVERYNSRELSDLEILQVEEHLAGCPECEDRVQDEVELPKVMRSSTVPEVRDFVRGERKRPAKR